MEKLTILVKVSGNGEDVEVHYEDRGVAVVREVEECPNKLSEGSLFRFEGYMYQVTAEYGTNAVGYGRAYRFECEQFYFEDLDRLTAFDN